MNPFEWGAIVALAIISLGLAFREAHKRKEREADNKD